MPFLDGIKRRCALGMIAALVPGASLAQDADGATFFDGFDTFDRGRWFVSDGWTNGDHQNCFWSGRAVDPGDGQVTLKFLPVADPARPYLCGEIQTRAVFGYGTFEARFRTDNASGINAAFFTYIGPTHKMPHDEIDFEVLTRDPSAVSLNTYVDGKPTHGQTVALPSPSDQNFHTYSFVWEPGHLRWFIDGVLVHEVASQILPSHKQKIYLSHWGSDTLSDWMGPFTKPDRPLEMQVDWVAYTALGAGCAFEGSVLCSDGFTSAATKP